MSIGIRAAIVLCIISVGLVPLAASAGGAANYTATGVPYKWDNSKPITYSIDLGDLGLLKHVQAVALVNKAFQQWASVNTASLTLMQDPDAPELDRDVTGSNLSDFLDGLPTDVNPVIFDNDGGVTDALLGAGASQSSLAFAVPSSTSILPQTAPDTGKIAQWGIVLNGRAMDGLFDPDDVTADDMTRATVQAVGQMLGLDSSDLNDEVIFAGKLADNSAVPVMHPGSTVKGDLVPVLGGGFTPTLDDRMAISALYPSTSFAASTGIIEGQVLLPDGVTGLQGIAVIGRKVDDPLNAAVSAISGASFETAGGLGSHDPSLRGQFEIHVPPGSYTLEFRPLRQPIGPLQAIFPLPGGAQFYQVSAAPAPVAGPVTAPASATPVNVSAGQTVQVNLMAAGNPAPVPQTIMAPATPHDTTETAPTLPLSATVSGHVAPSPAGSPGQIVLDTGGGTRDKVEDLYRLAVPERSVVTLRLEQKDKVDVDLYLFAGFVGGAAPPVVAASAFDGTDPEATQAVLDPGTYFIGVSAWDNVQSPVGTDYTLAVVTTPLPVQPPAPRPVLNQLVLGNLTDKSTDVSWITDTGASSVALVGMPRQQSGDPTLTMTHHLTVTGLTPGAYADLMAVSQNAAGAWDNLPKVYFRSADTTVATGPAQIQATISGELEDAIFNGDTDLNTIMIAIALRNTGGPATNVAIAGLTPSPGWKLAVPLSQPLIVGGIGTNGTAIVGVRLLRDGTGPAPLATVMGTGTFAGAGGATANFTIGG